MSQKDKTAHVESDKTAAAKVQEAIDSFFSKKGLTAADIDAMLDEHMRTPYEHAKSNE